MPLAVDKITKGESLDSVRNKISLTIEYLIKNEGKTKEQAAGQAFGMAADKWGRKIPRGN